MAIVTVEELRELFPPPEFADIADGTIERRIYEARLLHDVQKLATLYLVAHLLVLDTLPDSVDPSGGGSSGGGSVTTYVAEERLGPHTIKYGVSSSSTVKQSTERVRAEFFEQTKYGKRFLALERRTARSAIGAAVF